MSLPKPSMGKTKHESHLSSHNDKYNRNTHKKAINQHPEPSTRERHMAREVSTTYPKRAG